MNRTWNDAVNRLLWRIFPLHTKKSQNTSRLNARLDALLRLPSRSRYVRELVIGPDTWKWDVPLLQKLALLWGVIPHLSVLVFVYPTAQEIKNIRGANFDPVLRSLLAHGQHIKLNTFKTSYVPLPQLLPSSVLEQFLASQPSIQRLIGVEGYESWKATAPVNFLPHLHTIRCGPELSRHLIPVSRDIHTFCDASCGRAIEMLGLLSKSGSRVRCIDLSAFIDYGDPTDASLQQIVDLVPDLITFCWRLCPFKLTEARGCILAKLSSLETLVFGLDLDLWNPERVKAWASPFTSRLRQILFCGQKCTGLWERLDSLHADT